MIIFAAIILSSIWVLLDAKAIGAKKGRLKGIADMGPWGWFFGSLLLWIVAFPLYLLKRSEIKLAGATANINKTGLPNNSPKADVSDSIAQLEKLAELKSKGHLTEEEFAQKKRQILAG